MNNFNFDRFQEILNAVPMGLDKSQKKEVIPPKLREKIEIRDNFTCQCCGLEDGYGNTHWEIPGKLNIHHIIPNGEATLENLITLCKYCHNSVHLILYVSKKWRYIQTK